MTWPKPEPESARANTTIDKADTRICHQPRKHTKAMPARRKKAGRSVFLNTIVGGHELSRRCFAAVTTES